jgi:hypothetical protein
MSSPFALQSIFSARSISHISPSSSLPHLMIPFTRLNHLLEGNLELVFADTAFRSASSKGVRRVGPWNGGWNLLKVQIFVKG